jgi:hypothetical protein
MFKNKGVMWGKNLCRKNAFAPAACSETCLTALFVVPTPLLYAVGPEVPGAGTILQQIKPVVPPTPSAIAPGLKIESDNGAALPPSAAFMVKITRISDNTLFDTATLDALMADGKGRIILLLNWVNRSFALPTIIIAKTIR